MAEIREVQEISKIVDRLRRKIVIRISVKLLFEILVSVFFINFNILSLEKKASFFTIMIYFGKIK